MLLTMRADPLNSAEYSSKNIDHLGIVAMVCREIGLAGEIDRIVGVDPRQKVTCGEAVVAMVLNALALSAISAVNQYPISTPVFL